MSFFEAATLIGMVLGGGWALLQHHFALKEKLESHRSDTTTKAIDRLDSAIEKLGDAFSEFTKATGEKFDAFQKELTAVHVAMATNVSEIRAAREELNRAYEHFAGPRQPERESQVKQVGRDAFLVQSKKKDGK